MRQLLLLRHTESVKNVEVRFAEPDAQIAFDLTHEGDLLAQRIATDLAGLLGRTPLRTRSVYASTSQRSIATAQRLANEIGADVRICEGLNSIGSGVLAGKTETEAQRTHPDYIVALRLYRAGLLNSYDIPAFERKEDKRAFEERVRVALNSVLSHTGETLKIIVAQRSPLTAVLIDFARRFHNYPSCFFGHVQLDLGRVSWVEEVEHDRWRIRQVNVEWTDLILRGVTDDSVD